MSDYGIIIAKEGYPITSDTTQYDSGRLKLQSDVTHRPKHLDLINLNNVGTAFVDSTGGVTLNQKETLFKVEHGYGFVPFSFAYFYITQAPTVDAAYRGNYANTQFIISGDGTYADYIQMEVNNQYFKITHVLESYGSDSGYVSTIAQYSFQIKYYISSLIDGRVNVPNS